MQQHASIVKKWRFAYKMNVHNEPNRGVSSQATTTQQLIEEEEKEHEIVFMADERWAHQ